MKLSDSCRCGSEFEVEIADVVMDAAVTAHEKWISRHKPCVNETRSGQYV